MTLNEFRAKYRLQQRLTQRGVASYQAVDSSGRVVMVHSLDSASREEVDQVRGMVHRLNASDRKHILEILDVEGAPVIVTEYLQGFQALAQWLEVRTRGETTVPTAPAAPSFTQLFGPADIPKSPLIEETAPPPAPPPTVQGGEFTQLFGAIKDPAAAPVAPPDVTAEQASAPTLPMGLPPVTPPPAEQPKIVVRWREAPAEPPPAAPDKPMIRWKPPGTPDTNRLDPEPPPAKGPGEFTRLFGAHEGTQDSEPLMPEPPRPHAPPRPAVGKDGFTQQLRAAADSPGDLPDSPDSSGSTSPPAQPPPANAAPGAFTSLMSGIPSPGGGGAGSAAPPAAPGPSEFTRMMSGIPSPAPTTGGSGKRAHPPAAAPPPHDAEESEEQPSYAKLFIALGVVLLIAIALVVFFAIKK